MKLTSEGILGFLDDTGVDMDTDCILVTVDGRATFSTLGCLNADVVAALSVEEDYTSDVLVLTRSGRAIRLRPHEVGLRLGRLVGLTDGDIVVAALRVPSSPENEELEPSVTQGNLDQPVIRSRPRQSFPVLIANARGEAGVIDAAEISPQRRGARGKNVAPEGLCFAMACQTDAQILLVTASGQALRSRVAEVQRAWGRRLRTVMRLREGDRVVGISVLPHESNADSFEDITEKASQLPAEASMTSGPAVRAATDAVVKEAEGEGRRPAHLATVSTFVHELAQSIRAARPPQAPMASEWTVWFEDTMQRMAAAESPPLHCRRHPYTESSTESPRITHVFFRGPGYHQFPQIAVDYANGALWSQNGKAPESPTCVEMALWRLLSTKAHLGVMVAHPYAEDIETCCKAMTSQIQAAVDEFGALPQLLLLLAPCSRKSQQPTQQCVYTAYTAVLDAGGRVDLLTVPFVVSESPI